MLRSFSLRFPAIDSRSEAAGTATGHRDGDAASVSDWAAQTLSPVSSREPAARLRPSDEELLKRLCTRDPVALEILFERYARLFMGIGLRVLGDYGEAEEIVQDVFLYIYRKARLYDPSRGPAYKWIAQVAYHRTLDRRDYLQRRGFYAGTEAASPADILLGETDLDREIGVKLCGARLEKAFALLPERQRQTLEFFYFQGMDFHEIGERLNEPVSNVRHHYYRGLEKLRKSSFIREMREK